MSNDTIRVLVDDVQPNQKSASSAFPRIAIPSEVEVATDGIREGIAKVLDQLGKILESLPADVGGMKLAEIKASVHISGTGSVSLLSIVRAGATTGSAIEFVLRK